MNPTTRRLAPALTAAVGFILLCTASLQRRPPGLPERRTREPSPVDSPEPAPAARPRVSSPEEHWYHVGDPALIVSLIEKLDRLQREGSDLKPFCEQLRGDIGNILGQNHIHALPLLKRIVCDERLPIELKQTVLSSSGVYRTPEALQLMVDLVLERKISPDVRPMSVRTLAELLEPLRRDLGPELLGACLRAFELCLSSEDPQMRAEATSQYFRFREPTDPAEAGEALLRIFRSDPSADVHREAAAALARAPSTPRNEALALEMSAIVSRSTEFWERFAAFRVLLATCTERARKTILACLADPDESFRRSAIHGVGQYQLTEAVPLLGRWLNGPEALDDTSRLYCMNSLSVIPTAESARLLLRCAVENADESLKYAAVERLLANDALRGDELAAELIALYKKSRDLAGTDYLIDLLGKNGSIQAYKLLSADYHAATPERRDYIASVLLGYDHAPEFAAANLMDLVRTINGPGALRAAAQGDPRLAVPGLAKVCAMKDLPTETRSEAIQSLGRLGSPNAVEVLQQILKTETDEDLLRDIQRHLDRLSDDP